MSAAAAATTAEAQCEERRGHLYEYVNKLGGEQRGLIWKIGLGIGLVLFGVVVTASAGAGGWLLATHMDIRMNTQENAANKEKISAVCKNVTGLEVGMHSLQSDILTAISALKKEQ